MVIHDVEQGSPEWLVLRAGIPTGCEFKKLVTGTGGFSKSIDEYAKTLACEKRRRGPVDEFHGNKWTKAGGEDENNARKRYAFTSTEEVVTTGFITDDDVTHGVSPDGLVGMDGMLELKRLKASELVDMIYYIRKHNKLAPAYVPQTQGQMMVTGRKWCDVVFYNPDVEQIIIRVFPDRKFQLALIAQIRTVSRMRDDIMVDMGWL